MIEGLSYGNIIGTMHFLALSSLSLGSPPNINRANNPHQPLVNTSIFRKRGDQWMSGKCMYWDAMFSVLGSE